MCIRIISIIYRYMKIWKNCIIFFWVTVALILCSVTVSDDEWLHEAGTLLLDFSVLFMRDALSLKDLGNLLSSGEINLTELNSLTLSERSFVVHISSLLCSVWQIKLEDLKGEIGCERETSCLSLGRNNNMLPLCISLSFPGSVNISSIVKSSTELLLNSSNGLLLLRVECVWMILGQDQMLLELHIMIRGHDVQLFSYNLPVQSMCSCFLLITASN